MFFLENIGVMFCGREMGEHIPVDVLKALKTIVMGT
jgi:hypothetical protein